MRLRGMTQPWLLLGFMALLSVGLLSCGGDKSTSSGDDDDDDNPAGPQYMLEGGFGGTFVPGGFGLWIGRIDSDDPSASGWTVTLNGQDVPESVLSGDDDAFYSLVPFDYVSNVVYTIVASSEAGSATCTFTGPEFPIVEMTTPSGDTFVPGEPIVVTWQYDRSAPDHVYVNAYGDTEEEEEDDELIPEVVLPGSTTTYTIPGTTTEDWADEYNVLITVDAGEAFYPFTGSVAFVGSGIAMVFSGDAASLVPGAPEQHEWTVEVVLGAMTLPADGAGETTVYVTVQDQNYEYCDDGTTVTLSCVPAGAVTFAAGSLTTAYGTCNTTLTAGTDAGDVVVRATALEATGEADLTLLTAVHTVTVGTGQYPAISWQAPVGMSGLFLRAKGGVLTARWSLVTTGLSGFTPPLTYGTVPAGAQQTYPLLGAQPQALETGVTYQLGLIDTSIPPDTTMYEFTH